MITKIVFVINSTFDDRDYKRYGIDLLKSNGFEVEVWDCFPFLHPKAYEQLKDTYTPTFVGYKRCDSLTRMQTCLATLSATSYIIIPFFPTRETLPVYKAISQTQVRYAFLNLNLFPAGKEFWLKTILQKARHLTPLKLWHTVLNRSPLLLANLKPADAIVAAGSGQLRPFELIDSTTKTVCAHTMDYDNYLEHKNAPRPEGEEYGVFIDQSPPFHPDNIYSGIKPIATVDRYYPPLRNFFDRVESELGTTIVIASHPRLTYKPTDTYYGNRKVLRDKTVELIKNANFVLTHYSTAINFAVLFRKPLLFISTNELEAGPGMKFMRSMTSWFHKRLINVEEVKSVDWTRELSIDSHAYAAYKESFIKTNGSPDKPLWQIITDYLQGLT